MKQGGMRRGSPVIIWVTLATWTTLTTAHELDPAACAARFDVQRDKIIRTEESREMGARYLSELDVGARSECLRLCCETDACDVFVYEEKSPGSCYLFDCGPPEDFRCKFTAHGNFSSGVLEMSRRLAELQDQERLAHHERELAGLRTLTTSTSTAIPTPTPTLTTRRTSTTNTTPPPPPVPRTPPHVISPPTRGCSRYQFECRRGGECIAVYNACDGVPQCADGSDEAPELGCPPPVPPRPPQPASVAAAAPTRLKSLPESGEGGETSDASDDSEHWPHRLTQAQHLYSEAASGPRIFSHKGGLVAETAGPAPQYPPFEPPAPNSWGPQRSPWPHVLPQPHPGIDSIGGSGNGEGWRRDYSRLDWNDMDPRRAWSVSQTQPRADPDMQVYLPQKTMPEIPMVYSSQQHTLRDGPKKGFDLPPQAQPSPRPSGVNAQPPPPPAPLPETTTMKVLKEQLRAGAHTAGHEHFAPDEHDGLSERPPAAVLLLVLGVLMTAGTGALWACRARAARRRLRRGKAPFAHDPDYLVNGMYL